MIGGHEILLKMMIDDRISTDATKGGTQVRGTTPMANGMITTLFLTYQYMLVIGV